MSCTLRLANGSLMQCSAVIPSCEWSMGHCHFQLDLKVLPLLPYDLILGMDWLEFFSPMKFHCKQKWLSIPYRGTQALLQGLFPSDDAELVIQLLSLQDLTVVSTETEQQPLAISALLQKLDSLFHVPDTIPPPHSCDHQIPLVQGAWPVNIRQYRYSPALKDEIDRQVSAMLTQGLIRLSCSPFSFPVLLVKKKDGSWRFCVDYRYLNVMTIKSIFPIPVFYQLMDELAQARWLSTLDLYAGYHQIRLQKGEEYKTAFSTHSGHFEFKVMAFGLSGAPATF